MLARNLYVVAFGLSLLVVQSALGVLFPTHPVSPVLLLPVVLHLGASPDVPLIRGAFTSFFLGWAMDEFCGAPMGLSTFALVATYLATHGAVNQLFLRSTASQVALTFGVGMIAGGTMLALRAIFGPPEAFPLVMPGPEWLTWALGATNRAGGWAQLAVELTGASVATAAISPAIFRVMSAIDQSGTRSRRSTAQGVAA